ncbi:MAG: hypothetical protein ACQESC_04615 [Nanobdellota archaeon]
MMSKYRILNSRQKKRMRKTLSSQFGIVSLPDKVFFRINDQKSIFIANRESFDDSLDELVVIKKGLLFAQEIDDKIVLSIEGAQLLEDQIVQNRYELDTLEQKRWFRGDDIIIDSETTNFTKGKKQSTLGKIYALTVNDKIVGCGVVKKNVIKNSLSKTRLVSEVHSSNQKKK